MLATLAPPVIPFPVLASIKFDGAQAHVGPNQEEFHSRELKPFRGAALKRPDLHSHLHLTGELVYAPDHYVPGAATFQKTMSIIRTAAPHPLSGHLLFIIFNIPGQLPPVIVDDIIARPYDIVAPGFRYAIATNQKVTNREELENLLQKASERGYEGLMLRPPDRVFPNPYKRYPDVWKLKPVRKMPVIITGFRTSPTGLLASYLVSPVDNPNVTFAVGTGKGLTKQRRANPHPIGTRLVLTYRELTPAGYPKEPSIGN